MANNSIPSNHNSPTTESNETSLNPPRFFSLVLNRAHSARFELPANDWYQLAPVGEFPHAETGVIQVLDIAALAAMVERFHAESREPNFPGLLVDFDHFSYDPQQASTAAGWITALEQRSDGLWAQVRWSEAGQAALRDGRYRLISPVWLARDCETIGADPQTGAPRVRPHRLDSAGLTNSPNLKGLKPLSNRSLVSETKDETSCSRSLNTKPQSKGNMQQIREVLGLAGDAAEAAIAAEIAQLLERVKTAETVLAPLKNRVAELEQANADLLNTQVEGDLDRFQHCFAPEARAKWKAALLANRTGALELLQSIPATRALSAEPGAQISAAAPLHNRALAKHPPVTGFGSGSETDQQRKAVLEYKNRTHCTWQQAWDAVRGERPELFQVAE